MLVYGMVKEISHSSLQSLWSLHCLHSSYLVTVLSLGSYVLKELKRRNLNMVSMLLIGRHLKEAHYENRQVIRSLVEVNVQALDTT